MRKSISLLSATALLLALLVSCAKPLSALSAPELLSLGEKYLLELNYEQAAIYFEMLIDIEPRNPRDYTGAAEAYAALGQPERALEVLLHGAATLPDDESITVALLSLVPPSETAAALPTATASNEPSAEPVATDPPAQVLDLTREMLIGDWENINTGDIMTFSEMHVLPKGTTQDTMLQYLPTNETEDSEPYYIIDDNDVSWFAPNRSHLKDFGCSYDPETQTLTIVSRFSTDLYKKASNSGKPQASNPTIFDRSLYAELIRAFRTYEDSNWTNYSSPLIADSFLVTPQTEYGMTLQNWDSSMAGTGFPINLVELVFALHDLNNDGTPELMIGTQDDWDGTAYHEVFGVYSIVAGQVVSVYQKGHSREYVSIYSDGTIEAGWGHMDYAVMTRYSVTLNGSLKTEYSFEMAPAGGNNADMQFDADGSPIYEYTSDSGTVYTETQMKEVMARYTDTLATLEWNTLDTFNQ